MSEPVSAAVQRELMKLIEQVSRELRSISNSLDAVVAIVEGRGDD